ERDHPGEQEDEHRCQLQKRSEDCTAARVLLILASEHTLDNVLVGTPIPEADDGRTRQHGGPRPLGIVAGPYEVNVGTGSFDHLTPPGSEISVAERTEA